MQNINNTIIRSIKCFEQPTWLGDKSSVSRNAFSEANNEKSDE